MSKLPLDTKFHENLIAPSTYVAASATIVGDVRIGDQASVWFGAVVRGDAEAVQIGDRSNVQDLCVLHADPGFPCQIGCDVTIGHAAIVHGAVVGDGAMIGIRAVVLNGARIGHGAIVGTGAVVTENTVIPPGHLAVGVPAKVIRELTPENIERTRHAAAHYVRAAEEYRQSEADEV